MIRACRVHVAAARQLTCALRRRAAGTAAEPPKPPPRVPPHDGALGTVQRTGLAARKPLPPIVEATVKAAETTTQVFALLAGGAVLLGGVAVLGYTFFAPGSPAVIMRDSFALVEQSDEVALALGAPLDASTALGPRARAPLTPDSREYRRGDAACVQVRYGVRGVRDHGVAVCEMTQADGEWVVSVLAVSVPAQYRRVVLVDRYGLLARPTADPMLRGV